MTTLNDWDDAPSPAGDLTLHAHKLGLHDVPDDDCPACRVDRGAALLDERLPGWWEDVDVEALRLSDECRCVLGQLCGWYLDGLDWLRVQTPDAKGHGFDSADPTAVGYHRLTELWRSKINERRAR